MIDISDCSSLSRVMHFFEEISRIPHGSGNVSAIADYLCAFAIERGLSYSRDGAQNVVIRKPATPGYEKRPTVIIQGHTDMVCAVAEGVAKDMDTEGLSIYRDGDFLRAEGTTLGGDDGIAVAYALAILDLSDIEHPAIEACFTSDEEIGLLGAAALDASLLSGRIMINIDSDDEGVFTVGCAGGVRADVSLPVEREIAKGNIYDLSLFGLIGGHSGIEIDKGRENSIKLLAELLSDIGDAKIASFSGGNADNAIPRDAKASFFSDIGRENIEAIAEHLCNIYRSKESNIEYSLSEHFEECAALTRESSDLLLRLIESEPSGVIKMSEDIPGLPETSLNMGVASLADREFDLTFSIRSAKASAKAELLSRVKDIAEGLSASVCSHGDYPGWEYKKDSRLRDVMCKVYEEMYNEPARVVTIHAGLECGLFSDKLPGLDCVSIGPDNYDIHTPSEHLSLSSCARVWEFLLRVLKEI